MSDALQRRRSAAFLLSLGLVPACFSDPGGTASDSTTGDGTTGGTTGGPATSTEAATDASTTTTTDATTTTGEATTAVAPTTGPGLTTDATTGATDTTDATTGDPASVCGPYVAKLVECYPRQMIDARMEQAACEAYAEGVWTMSPMCAPLYEEMMACLSSLTCAQFESADACVAENEAYYACLNP